MEEKKRRYSVLDEPQPKSAIKKRKCSIRTVDRMHTLPDEIKAELASYLNDHELLTMSQVSFY